MRYAWVTVCDGAAVALLCLAGYGGDNSVLVPLTPEVSATIARGAAAAIAPIVASTPTVIAAPAIATPTPMPAPLPTIP